MSMQKMTEIDYWLIKRWKKARRFEKAMEAARLSYEGLFVEAHERVRRRWDWLPDYKPRKLSEPVTEPQWAYGGGCIAFFHPGWCCSRWGEGWPSGIWIYNISLDELAAEEAPAPNISICLYVSRRSQKRVEDLQSRLRDVRSKAEGRRYLRFEENDPEDDGVCLWYSLPEGRPRLLEMVLQKNGQPFISCIAKHVGEMAKLLHPLQGKMR
jgi:hypothetical protein